MNMKSIFSLYIFLSLVVTFGVVVQSKATQEIGISQTINDDLQDQLEVMWYDFSVFFREEVVPSPNVACKRDLINSVMQTEIGLMLEQAYLTFTGSHFSDVVNLFLDEPIQGINALRESLSNISPESLEQLELLIVTTMAVDQELQAEIGLMLEQAYLVFTGSRFSDIVKLFLDEPKQGINALGESLGNISPESLEQFRGFLIATDMTTAQRSQENVSNLREDLTEVRLKWYFCTI